MHRPHNAPRALPFPHPHHPLPSQVVTSALAAPPRADNNYISPRREEAVAPAAAGDIGAEAGSLLSPACTHDNIIRLVGVIVDATGATVEKLVLELAEVRGVYVFVMCMCV